MKLLVIDVQKGITNEKLYDFDGFIKNTALVIDTARKCGVEVIYVQHDDGPGSGFSVGDDAFEIAEQVKPVDGEKIYFKEINSCFGNKQLAEYLEKQKDRRLVIVGLQTNFCIDASVKSAFERGFEVIIPKGTNSTVDNDYMDAETTCRYYNEMMWPERFAKCVSVDEVITMMEHAD
ncbi:MAG: isochorismatase family protein [Lachnospiraceae bacterium]|nr:isochorismatase family protein [Lachnospiraceae bacterium]